MSADAPPFPGPCNGPFGAVERCVPLGGTARSARVSQ